MKKNNNKNIYGKANYNEDMVKSVKILLVVILILGIVYFSTALLTGEIKLGKSKENKEEVEIQYEEILSGQILNRSSKEYYVMLFKFTDNDASEIIAIKDKYSYQTSHLPIYLVDLDKEFNKSLLTENDKEVKTNVNDVNNIKVKDMTVLKVKDNKVISSIVGKDNIKKEFNLLEK